MKLLNHTLLIFAWLLFGGVFLLAQSPENMSRDDLFEFYGGDVPQSDESDRQVQPPVNNSVSADHALRTNACAAGFIMNTPYNSNNGQRGCMFDITATNAVTIRCFEANLYAGTTADYEIYYRPGTHVGFENNAAAWTFLGGETGVTSAGNNVPTALNIPINILIPAGNTYSFYITNTFGAGTSYTDGTAVGNFLAADANLTVFEGVGKSYPFGLTFNVRNFNGTIFYDLGTVLDGEDMILEGLSTEKGTVLTWDLPVSCMRWKLPKSSPLQKARPSPLKTTARTVGSSLSDRPASVMASNISGLRELSLSGRLRRTWARPLSSRSMRTMSVMGFAFREEGDWPPGVVTRALERWSLWPL